jgi:two-component system, chemotaxis family, protein-glutamate methylesterase/glutaminase
MSSGDAEELDWEVPVSLSADRTPLAARPGPGWVPSALSCPDCHGVLWEWRDGDLDRYRCRVGHGWSVQSLAQHQAEGVDAALWAVLKDVEEQAEFTRRLREAARDHGHRYDARYWGKQSKRAEQTAADIRQLLADRASSQDPLPAAADLGADRSMA